MKPTKTLLILSNGHGEDVVGRRLAQRIGTRAGERLRIVAFPTIGAGDAYRRAGIHVVGVQGELPSGGFAYLSLKNTLMDLRAGWPRLLLRQMAYLRRHRDEWDAVLGVGDLFSVYLNRFILKKPMSWAAIAYSVHSAGPSGYPVHPGWWRPLRRGDVQAFVRDPETRNLLRLAGIASEYVGNPMMDDLAPDRTLLGRMQAALGAESLDGQMPLIVLLPGSRQDAVRNLPDQLEALRLLYHRTGGRVRGAVAWAPWQPVEGLRPALARVGWRVREAGHLAAPGVVLQGPEGLELSLFVGAFAELIHLATLAIGQAGTAVEQAVGLGRPVVSCPSPGTQVTRSFLAAQQRLLGEALAVTEASPAALAEEALAILQDPARYRRMAAAGRQRMGPPGASEAIARRVVDRLLRGQVLTA
ncbi:lipid-A-disaccharide synthase-related protein [Limnochorda pilosa]|uniref:lipid-A-disaccharide synthase-related protein n=1 Tax=Limnochorda pilosa TaxID=1555112 RepID=UPI00130D777D|nr:lipid-A-disaccharide synthase-related protein [Limnochorda pilosa]